MVLAVVLLCPPGSVLPASAGLALCAGVHRQWGESVCRSVLSLSFPLPFRADVHNFSDGTERTFKKF